MGGVALVSGAAAFLRVSALLAGIAFGFTLAMVGGRQVGLAFRALAKAERPLYLGLLFLVGAHVHAADAYVWAVLPLYVALRFAGKRVGGQLAAKTAQGTLRLPPKPGYA